MQYPTVERKLGTPVRKIYKYQIPPVDIKFKMKIPGRILTVQLQNGRPMIWAEVNTEIDLEEIKERSFEIYGTGTEIDYDMIYVGTYQMEEFVFHLYEEQSAERIEFEC